MSKGGTSGAAARRGQKSVGGGRAGEETGQGLPSVWCSKERRRLAPSEEVKER